MGVFLKTTFAMLLFLNQLANYSLYSSYYGGGGRDIVGEIGNLKMGVRIITIFWVRDFNGI
jgi:hypothetical protein